MQLVFDFPVNPKFTFNNFVICSGNETAFRFARLLIDDDSKNLLYLHGPPGCGKTHLLHAVAGMLCCAKGRTSLPLVSFKEADEIYHGNYPTESLSRLGERFRDEPALLVDDIHLLPDFPQVRSEFWQLFNEFYDSGRKIAIAGLFPPREIPSLDDHIASRLMWGLAAGLDISDDESLRMIMKKLAADRNILVPAEVIDYLLHHVRRELPPLLNLLERMHRHSLATGRRITLRLARETLGF